MTDGARANGCDGASGLQADLVSHALEHHTALITGASRGIGRAIAVALAREGSNVVLLARTESALRETAALCEAQGARALALAADVTDTDAMAQALEHATQQFDSLDIVVANHGIHHHGASYQADLQAWKRVLDVNLYSTMALARLSLPAILRAPEARHRALIFIASISGKTANAGGAAYCASKHGVVGFAHAVFEDVRDEGIKVSAICPGYVNTAMVAGAAASGALDPSRMLQPEDVADAVRAVVLAPATACSVEIILRPQRAPARG